MTPALEVSHLKKRFGDQAVLEDVSFTVKPNTVYGFLGKNGSGKTTTIKCILGLMQHTSGKVRINNRLVEYGKELPSGAVGFLPDVPEYYHYLTANEYLHLCGQITEMTKKERQAKIAELLNLVGLEDTKKKIGGYSRGMKQRLGIAQALIHDPLLLICDEPTSALDPLGRKDVLAILKKVSKKTTVVFSTHILADVEAIADEVAILHDGKIARSGSLAELTESQETSTVSATFHSKEETVAFKKILTPLGDGEEIEVSNRTISVETLRGKTVMTQWLALLSEQGRIPEKIEWRKATLEDVFLEVTK
ncbi:ABC transporter ATP-binding protein [Lacticigenium naphthae]|uniref:ABC transporter ATP-binding protein n=1 Tax=Lacticigenium naphthae TaxID=515351 RepID=UPI000403F8DF|nr:ABC transporter ATP-binding protein [Lacticigenium naphthae]